MPNNDVPCCPPLDKGQWDGKTLDWKDRLFVKVKIPAFFRRPINFRAAAKRAMISIQKIGAEDFVDKFVMLTHCPTPWTCNLYISVTKNVPGQEMTKLSGTFVTKVFEGPFGNISKWMREMENEVAKKHNKKIKKHYFYYPTCPKCSKRYGHNYAVDVAEV